uniref:RNA polymerase beta' subunit n=1 Tax=Hormidiella parvula TaxID=2058785 RepID=UPI00286BFED7|nr:RNA polymerase beta' subunit [Hormidiella parvula]WKT05951.1 RNA polymerase beta' subunit [Hormidiella parvula]
MIQDIQSHQYLYLQVGLASPRSIKAWCERCLPDGQTVGQVTEPQTLHYTTHKPIRDGLFCERIFGPLRDWQCACGVDRKKDQEEKGLQFCEQCGVEITRSRVRRYRMGYIQLVVPVVHPWYLKGVPNIMANLLSLKLKQIKQLAYYERFMVITRADRPNLLPIREIFSPFCFLRMFDFFGARLMRKLRPREMGVGAEAIAKLLDRLDMREVKHKALEEWKLAGRWVMLDPLDSEEAAQWAQRRGRKALLTRRINISHHFHSSHVQPIWMVFSMLPVLPPDLRPMIHLDADRFVASDLNELYRQVLYRNRMVSEHSKDAISGKPMPGVVFHGAQRLLQDAVDILLKDGVKKRPYPLNQKPLRSLSNLLEGKTGRFRQNLLGKRVDYSGRSVIVVGPKLRMHQCGLPVEMALELFQPFLIQRMLRLRLTHNIRRAKRMLQHKEKKALLIELLKQLVQERLVLLNRAPTLHRMGVQAFQPILITGRAIQLHPLVCTAFNADFDGDQMAVHLPLSQEAQAEARVLMLSSTNLISPATGDAIAVPSQDMILGLYALTSQPSLYHARGRFDPNQPCWQAEVAPRIFRFSCGRDVLRAYAQGILGLHSSIWMEVDQASTTLTLRPDEAPIEVQCESDGTLIKTYASWQIRQSSTGVVLGRHVLTTTGRIILNEQIQGIVRSQRVSSNHPPLAVSRIGEPTAYKRASFDGDQRELLYRKNTG